MMTSAISPLSSLSKSGAGLSPASLNSLILNQLALKRLDLELARRKMLNFCQWTKPDWVTAPHHKLLCELADRVICGQSKRIIVSLPPRHTKSEIFSIRFPALYLAHHPSHQIIHASYAASLSNEFSRQVRALVRDSREFKQLFPTFWLDEERARLDDWKVQGGGGFLSVGSGAGITGKGAHLLILDDIHKEGDEQSMLTLDQTYSWYVSAARTRLMPGAAVVVVATRWHPSDLIGRLQEVAAQDPDADQWEVVTLPALAYEGDILGRTEGEPLWPERYDLTYFKQLKALSPAYFESLFQQNPQPGESKLFDAKNFKLVPAGHDRLKGVAVWAVDLAVTEKETSDFSVWARFQHEAGTGRVRMIWGERVKQEWPATRARLEELLQSYPYDVFVFPEQTYELMAVQDLRSRWPKEAHRIKSVKTQGDKRARAAAYAHVVAAGLAEVEEGEFATHFIKEHDRFPDRNDDCVDVSSLACQWFGVRSGFGALLGPVVEVPDAPPAGLPPAPVVSVRPEKREPTSISEYWDQLAASMRVPQWKD